MKTGTWFKHRPAFLVAVIASVVGTGLITVWLVLLSLFYVHSRSPSDAIQERQMADGTILVLEKVNRVTRGESYKYSFIDDQSFWDWVTGRFNALGGCTVHPTSENGVVVWLYRRDPKTRHRLDFDWLSHCTVLDDSGHEFNSLQGSGTCECGRDMDSTGPQSRLIVAHCTLPIVRYSNESFKLRVYDTKNTVVAEFDVPNPDDARKPVWQPDSLPAKRIGEHATVTLSGLRMESVELPEGSGNHLPSRLLPELLIDEHPNGNIDTTICRVRVVDALGGSVGPIELRLNQLAQQSPDDWSQLNFFETAWKLQVTLCPGPEEMFPEHEQWVVKDIAIPEPGNTIPVKQVRVVNGTYLELIAAGGRETVMHTVEAFDTTRSPTEPTGDFGGGLYAVKSEYRNNACVQTLTSNCPHIVVRADSLTANRESLLRAEDDMGRTVRVKHLLERGIDYWLLDLHETARSVNLTLIVHEGPEFEFFVVPPPPEKWLRRVDR
ncbi:MAG: hypothetical protein EXS05_03930 [Planctomycetaceae bacterium]|nr:hypothetical protein [Planctomycetaceae bacterium]